MSVHYKFKSALEYDTVTFDGLHISVKDLKNSIIQQKRIGKSTDFDLQVTNAQTKEVYDDDQILIPKNTSLLIARIPLIAQNKSKSWEGYGTDQTPAAKLDEGGPASKAVDLANLDASEDDKIRAMMSQSTQDYDPSNYMKIRGANQVGAVPPNYKCYKCHQGGHWIKDCPLGQGTEQIEIKKSTGIPRSFMVPVDGPQVPGAMMTPYGSYAVPVLDHQTYSQKPVPLSNNPPPVHKTDIPEDLVCTICKDLLSDAVMIPCCGNSFCDECIRSSLLESEDHECPDCHDRDISPGTLIPNRFLRNSVSNFKNTTGYVKKQAFKVETPIQKENIITIDKDKEVENNETEVNKSEKSEDVEKEEKTVISEADSTEACKTTPSDSETKETPEVKEPEKEFSPASDLPPGVSPKRETTPPKSQPITAVGSVSTHHRERTHQSSRQLEKGTKPRSPRRHNKHHRSPQRYQETRSSLEDRAGTPTIDEPGMGGINNGERSYQSTNAPYPSGPPSMPILTNLGPNTLLQGPPPNLNQPQNQFPPQMQFPQNPNMVHNGPPPNFRLPPPGPNPSNFMHGMYNAPPRSMFEPTRPQLQGPPPNFQGFPNRHRGRDFGRGRSGRTPPRIIDDPLEAFNKMLREKDERERRAKQRKGRSFSRSSSRSYSRSPRRRSRSPRRRSRSRSKSFGASRSRSRSFTPLNRASPYRDYSPRRRVAARYKSPQRSPSRYRYKDGADRPREREFDRDYERDRERDRDYGYNKRDGTRGYNRDKQPDYHYYDNYEQRDRDKAMPRTSNKWGTNREGYYPQEAPVMYHQSGGPPPMQQVPNRYPREQYPVYKQNHLHPSMMQQQPIMSQLRYDDVAPPGTEQPLPPGEEPPPRYDDRHLYDHRSPDLKTSDHQRDIQNEPSHDERGKHEFPDNFEQKKHGRSSQSPTRSKDRNSSPIHKSKRYEGTPERKPEKEKRRDHSDDDKNKRTKEKKKKRDKKETEKKVKKDKKEKREHKKDRKEKSKTDKDKREEVVPKAHKTVTEVEQKPITEEGKTDKKEIECTEKKIEISKFNPVKLEETLKKIDVGLYEDVLTEGIDSTITESYGKIEEIKTDFTPEKVTIEAEVQLKGYTPLKKAEEDPKEYDDVLEIYTGDLKSELDKEVLAPLPEKSKWEIEDDPANTSLENQQEIKNEKSNKVTNEVLKRAENAIFAKAINAIRPIEIKKISLDRAKFYSGEKEDKIIELKAEPSVVLNIDMSEKSKHENELAKPVRLSVKERLGCKVDDLDRIVHVDKVYDKNKSRSLSPLAKRHQDIKNERRVEVEDKRRERDRNHDRDRNQRAYRSGYERRDRDDARRHDSHRDRRGNRDRSRNEESRVRTKREDKRKRTRSKSDDKKDKQKKREKKQKKEKPRKIKKDNEGEMSAPVEKKKLIEEIKELEKKKLLVEEDTFIPDYDLETESEEDKSKQNTKGNEVEVIKKAKIEEKTETSSSESSSSSSEDERKKKKHKKHKKRKRKESSSSSSDSDSSSSEEEKDRKKKKHKKKHKKKKKSKHK